MAISIGLPVFEIVERKAGEPATIGNIGIEADGVAEVGDMAGALGGVTADHVADRESPHSPNGATQQPGSSYSKLRIGTTDRRREVLPYFSAPFPAGGSAQGRLRHAVTRAHGPAGFSRCGMIPGAALAFPPLTACARVPFFRVMLPR